MPQELNAFDIVIHFKRDYAPVIHISKELEEVFRFMDTEHGEWMLQFNWMDDTVKIIKPPKTEANLEQQDAKVDNG